MYYNQDTIIYNNGIFEKPIVLSIAVRQRKLSVSNRLMIICFRLVGTMPWAKNLKMLISHS